LARRRIRADSTWSVETMRAISCTDERSSLERVLSLLMTPGSVGSVLVSMMIFLSSLRRSSTLFPHHVI